MEHKPSGSKLLSSVGAGLRLLKMFSADEPELGITVLAKRLQVAKSTAHRLASTLVAEGFLEQNPADGKYRLGLLLFSLGGLVRLRMEASEVSVPFLRALCDQTGETVHLGVLLHTETRFETLYVRNIESPHAIRPRSYLGVRMPAFCTCEGRVLLAFGPSAQEQQVLSLPLEPRTSSTVTDPKKLQPILERIRAQGFALDDEESETGMRGIAAPVRDASSEVVAAVGLVGPVQRLSDERVAQYTPKLLETALAISKGLGYSQPLGSSSLTVGKQWV